MITRGYTYYSMCMATLSRRLQILMDEERAARLERLAAQRGTSVAALLREAVDIAFPDSDARRRAAAGRRLLEAPPMPVPADWQELKRESRASLFGEAADP
jgi:hypothetical protein